MSTIPKAQYELSDNVHPNVDRSPWGWIVIKGTRLRVATYSGYEEKERCKKLIESIQLATDGREEDRACPCKYLDEPCNEMCTCKNGLYSTGCLYCCTYGSLEQRKEQAKKLKAKLDGREELEKELALYKTKVEFYREQTDKVRELIFGRNDIGEPCQPLYDAIFDKITALQSQCTEKEKEIVELKRSILSGLKIEGELKAENERLKKILDNLD